MIYLITTSNYIYLILKNGAQVSIMLILSIQIRLLYNLRLVFIDFLQYISAKQQLI